VSVRADLLKAFRAYRCVPLCCIALKFVRRVSVYAHYSVCSLFQRPCIPVFEGGRTAPCHVLQHAATHCGTLQHTAPHCTTLQHTATHCNTLQPTATRYNTLQHIVAHCNTLQHTATHCNTLQQHTANTLQRNVAVCWLQCVAVSANTLQSN